MATGLDGKARALGFITGGRQVAVGQQIACAIGGGRDTRGQAGTRRGGQAQALGAEAGIVGANAGVRKRPAAVIFISLKSGPGTFSQSRPREVGNRQPQVHRIDGRRGYAGAIGLLQRHPVRRIVLRPSAALPVGWGLPRNVIAKWETVAAPRPSETGLLCGYDNPLAP